MDELPDELLGIILSHLTLKEAVASSILSQRWRYLWTLADIGRLDFDGTKSLSKLDCEDRENYVKWVNHVITLRKDTPLDEFKVCFRLSKAEEGVVHEWVRYALEMKVQTLELNLSGQGSGHLSYGESCSFPYSILQQGSWPLINLKQLRRISLEAVKVSGEALEFFLCNCPLLEGLSVSQSKELVTLRVIGPLPSLKLLEIRCCMSLKSVEIRDVVSLVCLKYSGPGTHVEFVVKNAPSLVELFVGAWVRLLGVFLHQFGGILGPLEMLNLEMRRPEDCWGYHPLKFLNLKQLVVTYLPLFPSRIRCMLRLANIIKAAPHLEKYVLKADVGGSWCEKRFEHREKSNMHKKLKEVEFVGYGGVACELKFVVYLVDTAPALQKITIHPKKFPRTNLIPDRAIEARARAHQQLAAHVPHPIILEIL